MNRSILVLGLGNPLLSDEGVGPRAIEALASFVVPSSGVELLDGGTAGLSLVPRVAAAGRLLVLDAVRAGRRPGSVLKLDGRALARDLASTTSPHQIGVADILSAAHLMGGPEEVVILGIEPDTTEIGIGLSAPVEGALPKLVGEALAQLGEWGVTFPFPFPWEEARCTSSR
jgi:hydrogenase maturation protease